MLDETLSMNIRPWTFRDLAVIDLGNDNCIVVSCDSAAAIGPKPLDCEKASIESVAYFCTRVALIEQLTVKSRPCVLINTLGMERDPAGTEALSGIRRQLAEEMLLDSVHITGS